MGGVLQLDPGAYVAASATVGVLVAGTVRAAGDGVVAVLSGCAAMAGSDPAGLGWAGGYDVAAAAVLAATGDAVAGACRLAGLLEQTGFNYGTAEAASVTGGGGPAPVDTGDYGGQPVSLGPVPSASGPSDAVLPTAWSQVQDHVARVWPNGHQDRLRRAAVGWHDGACQLYDASYQLADAVAAIAAQVSPEREDAITVCNRLRDTLQDLAENYNTLSAACEQYATHLDQAHQQARTELRHLLEWIAGIEIAGAAVAILTFGASEVVSQATVLARTILTGTRIAAIIDRLTLLAAQITETITTIPSNIALITRELNPLTTARRVAAITDTVEAIRTGKTATIVLDRLAIEASVDLTKVPANARAAVLDALERARTGKIRFTGHDGKEYANFDGALPGHVQYRSWTAAAAGQPRGRLYCRPTQRGSRRLRSSGPLTNRSLTTDCCRALRQEQEPCRSTWTVSWTANPQRETQNNQDISTG